MLRLVGYVFIYNEIRWTLELVPDCSSAEHRAQLSWTSGTHRLHLVEHVLNSTVLGD